MKIILKIPAGWPSGKVVALIQMLTELAPFNANLKDFDVEPIKLDSDHEEYRAAYNTYRAQCRKEYGTVAAAILATASAEALASTSGALHP